MNITYFRRKHGSKVEQEIVEYELFTLMFVIFQTMCLTFAHLFLIVIVILKMRGKKVTFSQPHCFIIQRHYKTEKEGNRVYKRCKRTQNNTSKDKYLMSMIRFYFCVYFAESLLFPTIGLNVTILLESGPMK